MAGRVLQGVMAVFCLLSFGLFPTRGFSQATANTPKSEMHAEAGAVMSSGNADSQSFNARVDVAREWRRWRQAFGASGVYAADDAGATGQRWDARGQTSYKFLSQGFSFISARYERDRFSGFEYQSAFAIGLGWRFFDDETTRLVMQVGAGYRHLRTRDSLADDDVTVVPGERQEDLVEQFGLEFSRALNDRTRVRNQLQVEIGIDNTQVRNDLGLQVKVFESLALALGYSVRYNTHPPEGFDTTDTLSTLNLVYELK